MKVLPWILTIVFASCTVWLYSKQKDEQNKLTTLQAQVAELEAAAQAAPEQDSAEVDLDEVERLRRENEEIHKLRGEVSKLRRENQQLTVKVQQISAQHQQVQSELTAVAQQQVPQPGAQPEQEDPGQRLLREQSNMCVGHMTMVEDAKSQWAQANNKTGGDAVTLPEIAPYLPNQTLPSCPGGGSYSLNEIGIPVTCSIPEHSLLP
jgi:hypothetical protein